MKIRTLLPLCGLLILPFAAPESLGRRTAPPAILSELELSDLIPARALVYAEAPGLSKLMERGLDHPLVRAVLDSPLGEALLAEAEHSPEQALELASAIVGAPVLETLSSLTAGGVALGVQPRAGKPRWLLVARGDDAARWREVLDLVLAFTASKIGIGNALASPHDEIRGADVWHLGDELCFALRGPVFMASGNEGSLRAGLDLLTGKGEHSLSERESFARSRASMPDDSLVWSWVDLDGIDEMNDRTDREGKGLTDMRDMVRKPEIQFLLGPGISLLGVASQVSGQIALRDEDLHVSIRAAGVEPGPVGRIAPHGELVVDTTFRGRGLDAVLYRDFAGIFAERAELFPVDVQPAFAKSISDLAVFFGGKDFAEDILPALSPWIRVVARAVTFDEGATPEIPLPAVCALIEVRDPDRIGTSLVASFQSAISLINIDRAQKGMDPMLLSLRMKDGVQITFAQWLQPAEGDGVDMRYNLVPACALVDSTFVVGTHVGIVEDVIGQLRDATKTKSRDASLESLEISGGTVADVLGQNMETLALIKSLEEGVSIEEARGEFEGLRALAGMIDRLRIEISYQSSETIELTLDLDLVAGASVR